MKLMPYTGAIMVADTLVSQICDIWVQCVTAFATKDALFLFCTYVCIMSKSIVSFRK